MPERSMSPDERLQQEFNRWAEEGRGEEMETHHVSIAEQSLRLMDLKPGERILDLGCGTGWLTRLLARMVAEGPEGFGQVVGLDVSDEMIRRARASSRDFDNVMFVWGSAQQIPWEENFFDKVVSVESFYYYPDLDRTLAELFRVMAPRGRMFILINLYKDNPLSLRWQKELKVPVHVLSEAEYIALLRAHTFEEVEACRIPDLSPTPDVYSGQWFSNAEELREFKRTGALLLTARKPDFRSPAPGYQIY
jgi:arsenite methyltransferase